VKSNAYGLLLMDCGTKRATYEVKLVGDPAAQATTAP
jgi:hypothetical protein